MVEVDGSSGVVVRSCVRVSWRDAFPWVVSLLLSLGFSILFPMISSKGEGAGVAGWGIVVLVTVWLLIVLLLVYILTLEVVVEVTAETVVVRSWPFKSVGTRGSIVEARPGRGDGMMAVQFSRSYARYRIPGYERVVIEFSDRGTIDVSVEDAEAVLRVLSYEKPLKETV